MLHISCGSNQGLDVRRPVGRRGARGVLCRDEERIETGLEERVAEGRHDAAVMDDHAGPRERQLVGDLGRCQGRVQGREHRACL